MNISITSPGLQDIDALVALNRKWQKEILSEFRNGFLSVEVADFDFKKIIENQDIIICKDDDKLCGYYLINNFSIKASGYYASKVLELKARNMLPATAKVGLCAQALVDSEYQGLGLREKMLHALVEQVSTRYDYLCSTISKMNHRAFKAHSRDGWQVIDQDDQQYFVILHLETFLHSQIQKSVPAYSELTQSPNSLEEK